MNDQSRSGRVRADRVRALAFVGAYLAAASVVCWSAVAAKQMHLAPALAAIETSTTQPLSATVAESAVTVSSQSDSVQTEVLESQPTLIVEEIEYHDEEIRYFNGRAVRPAKTYWMTITGYSPDERSCGKWADGITASNKSVWTNAMQLVAADTRILPFGSLLSIEGYANGQIVPVEDRGGAIKGMRLDLLYPSHEEALQWGVKRMPVTVWEYIED